MKSVSVRNNKNEIPITGNHRTRKLFNRWYLLIIMISS